MGSRRSPDEPKGHAHANPSGQSNGEYRAGSKWPRAMGTRVTALAAGLPADLTGLPSFAPGEFQLADLELLLSGAFKPLSGFMCDADATAVARYGSRTDGTPFPFPVTLDVPADVLSADAGMLVLEDPEGAPLAVVEITARSQAGPGGPVRIAGPVRALREPEHGPFRRLRRGPGETRAELVAGTSGPHEPVPPKPVPKKPVPQHVVQQDPVPQKPAPRNLVLAFATRGPLHRRELGQLRHLADAMRARLLLLPLVAGPAELVTRPEALVRTVLAVLPQLPADTLVVPVPLAPRGREGTREELLARALVAAAYGATHLFAAEPVTDGQAAPLTKAVTRDMGSTDATIASVPGSPVPLVLPGEWAFDLTAEVWRPAARIEPTARRAGLTVEELTGLLDRGDEIPDWFTTTPVARELRAARPPRHERGLVLFFTGLSGAGSPQSPATSPTPSRSAAAAPYRCWTATRSAACSPPG